MLKESEVAIGQLMTTSGDDQPWAMQAYVHLIQLNRTLVDELKSIRLPAIEVQEKIKDASRKERRNSRILPKKCVALTSLSKT